MVIIFFFSSRRRHTRYIGDWNSDVCSSDLTSPPLAAVAQQICPQGDRGQWGRSRVRGILSARSGGIFSEIGRASCRERRKQTDGRNGIQSKREQRTGRRKQK